MTSPPVPPPSLEGADILVTGGAGAIGSWLVRRLLELPVRRVVVIDDLSSGYRWLLPDDERLDLVEADVVELQDLDLPLAEPVVFHLAALFANQNSVDHPLADLHTNGAGTLATLLWARDRDCRRLIYASAGCSIAGHGLTEPIREDMPVSLDLDTPYQITKALGEFYCNYFLDSVSTVRCRFFNSYGPGEVPGPYRNVIPNFIARALTGAPLVITGTGRETRDFIFVDDLVSGLLAAATTLRAHGEALNLGTGIQTPILALAESVIELTDSTSEIVYAPRRPWDKSTHRQADISKAAATLGFEPRTDLASGLRRTIDWFREHKSRMGAAIEGVSA